MTQPTPSSSGSSSLRPRARILRTFGDELISSETVAIIELVKNAYDADATRVLVRFYGPLTIGQGKIEVIDNGHGMSLETIRTAWMEPATLMRKRERISELRGRRVLGEKGIGRFAVSRLADFLEVVTRRSEMARQIRVYFDWSQFDDEAKYLDQVEVLWEEELPSEICQGGTIEALWKLESHPGPTNLTHGTILRMEQLRATWGQDQLEDLRSRLSRLISPGFDEELKEKGDEFKIRLELPPPFESLSGDVEPPEALSNPHYMLRGAINETAKYDLANKLRGQEGEQRIQGRFTLQNGREPTCGPFHIELRVWDRDQVSLSELAHRHGTTLTRVRQDLDSAAGISIYRDGFRVLPYGDPLNDWLRLDLRRVQNPTLRLSNNQILGYVLVSAEANPALRDQSNREGLIESQALDDLRDIIKMVLVELEARRYGVRHPSKATPRRVGGLFADFDLAAVRDYVAQQYATDTKLLSLLGEKEQDLERRVQEVQEVLARYRRLATLGELIDIVLHDGRAPLTKIGNEALLALRDLGRSASDETVFANKLQERLDTIKTQVDILSTVFRRIEPFGGRKRGRPVRTRLENVIADAVSVLDREIAEVGVQVDLPKSETEVTVDQAEIQEIIINLLQNSLYWLRQVPPDSRRVAVVVRRRSPDEVEVLFSDSGPGVQQEFKDRIFEPYFSTKPEGIGLGLTIAGEIVSDYYSGELELLDTGPLPGATFRITLRRRV